MRYLQEVRSWCSRQWCFVLIRTVPHLWKRLDLVSQWGQGLHQLKLNLHNYDMLGQGLHQLKVNLHNNTLAHGTVTTTMLVFMNIHVRTHY